MYTFQLVPKDHIPWGIIHGTEDSTIYKVKEWFDYLYRWKKILPFIVEINQEHNVIGYFVGEKIKKGINIIGSPFEGIGTAHQGLSMVKKITPDERIKIYNSLSKWIFSNRHGMFVQIEDWQLTLDDCEKAKAKYSQVDGYLINLSLDEDVLYHNLHQKSCRYSINKSIKQGVTIRETEDSERFIDIYYDQLLEVFAKQGLSPTYEKDCVKALVESLYPQKLLLLEAVSADGEIIATALFPGEKNLAVFWGGASYQKYQKLCPNEPLIWEGIKRWKERGTKFFDMCGVRQYKLKFGPELYAKPRLYYAKYPLLISLKEFAKKTYYSFRAFKAIFKK